MVIARLNPFLPRQVETRPSNLGKVLLFCEGQTEVLYFEYFADIIRKNRNKYAHLHIESIPANGNAQQVLNFAEDFLQNEDHLQKYLLFEKHLVKRIRKSRIGSHSTNNREWRHAAQCNSACS